MASASSVGCSGRAAARAGPRIDDVAPVTMVHAVIRVPVPAEAACTVMTKLPLGVAEHRLRRRARGCLDRGGGGERCALPSRRFLLLDSRWRRRRARRSAPAWSSVEDRLFVIGMRRLAGTVRAVEWEVPFRRRSVHADSFARERCSSCNARIEPTHRIIVGRVAPHRRT